jgi:hypothetical protein
MYSSIQVTYSPRLTSVKPHSADTLYIHEVKMKNSFLSYVGLIAIVLLIVGVFWYLNTPRTTQIADIPTPSGNAQTAATRITEATITPGPAGADQVPTLMPWTDVYVEGDEALLKDALSQKLATDGFDFRISSEVTTANSGVYCIQGFVPKPGSNAEDHPVIQALTFIPGTRYCSMVATIGSLYGGVNQKDLRVNTVVEGIDDTPVVDTENRTIAHPQAARVTFTARMGLLTFAVQPGNTQKRTIDDPASALRAFIDASKRLWIGDETFFQQRIDEADTLALELAQWEIIAPLKADGSRSTQNLDRLYTEVVRQFTQSSYNDTNPWPYDNLQQECEIQAKAAGFTGCTEIVVNITMPFEDGKFYYLQGMDSTPQLVIPDDHLSKFWQNLYWYYTDLATNGTPDRTNPRFVR